MPSNKYSHILLHCVTLFPLSGLILFLSRNFFLQSTPWVTLLPSLMVGITGPSSAAWQVDPALGTGPSTPLNIVTTSFTVSFLYVPLGNRLIRERPVGASPQSFCVIWACALFQGNSRHL